MIDNALKWLSFFIGSGVLIFIARLIFSGGKYCKTVDALEKDTSEANKKLDTLIFSFNRLISKLENFKELRGLDDIFFKTTSPKNLTDLGKQMLQESGLVAFITSNKQELIQKVKSSNPQTDYDVEQKSMDVMTSLSGDQRLNTIKDYAFKNGKDLILMLMASGIYLRDIIISEKPN
ncbi:MAG: hypothetical protein ABFC84_16650 [Veillonellales bacterium]